MTDTIWSNERRLWLEGVDVHAELLHPDCIMTFAAPVGIMKGEVILRSLEGAPRWTDIDMTERSRSDINGDTVVIAYRAEGRRGDSAPYRAFCSSTYVRHHDSAWRIIQHQQTPIG